MKVTAAKKISNTKIVETKKTAFCKVRGAGWTLRLIAADGSAGPREISRSAIRIPLIFLGSNRSRRAKAARSTFDRRRSNG